MAIWIPFTNLNLAMVVGFIQKLTLISSCRGLSACIFLPDSNHLYWTETHILSHIHNSYYRKMQAFKLDIVTYFNCISAWSMDSSSRGIHLSQIVNSKGLPILRSQVKILEGKFKISPHSWSSCKSSLIWSHWFFIKRPNQITKSRKKEKHSYRGLTMIHDS